jgi:hypothetical protein
MADNFNLRAFLTENKLTKNAQLLKEQEEDYKYFDEEGTGGFYMTTIDGVKIYSLEDSSIMDTCFYALEDEDGDIDFISIDVSGEPVSSEDIQNEQEILSYIADFIEEDINSQLEEEGLLEASRSMKNKMNEADWRNNPYTPHNFDGVARQAQQSKELQAVANRMFPEFGGELENLGAPLTPEQRDAVWATWSKEKVAREKAERETMKETKLTAKERRLVEMVQDAMGYTEEAHQNPDPNVPNDSTDMAIDMMKNGLPEGEEMVQDKPLPKYNSIEELMKEIEHGTNEAAHKYKMEEMKRVYEVLEAKVGSLEEGEHAEHIDQKAVKQMRKDIAALRKAEEKLRKEFDKKFSGKEKKETPAKEKATEALQEGFDLRKFLVENKLTAGSKLVSENEEQVDELFGFGRKKYKEGDLVFYKDEKEPRKISRVFDNKGTTMYDLSTPEQDGVFFKNGGYSASDAELKPVK